ncbi:hypothetical protein AQUCO_13600007v1 [Aquilegia coerulea]|uniref:KIB1-4 beta-propeller domain-containing protein n=1 Tax=Aquilegia coerulea TaxID=218851 RepID=A0A2G5C2D1_AQUCA|nr:hypothetical protein AQUCO_13600007v1 [Aquilegia coerulea]
MYSFKVLVPFFMDYKGSSHGCLVLVGRQGKGIHVRLSFPLLSKHEDIDLPPLRGQLSEIKKVILSANPSSNHTYTVMAMINYRKRRLAFYKPAAGDQADWTYISSSYEKILDILYYNKNQQFYFVEESGTVFACDVNDPNDPKVLPILAPPSYPSFGQSDDDYLPFGYFGKYLYLVELSSWELLLIKMCRNNKDESRHCIIGFSVYKMNPLVEPKWIEVQNLSGDTIFLGNYSSLAVRASDFRECKPNCIYFTDWYVKKCSDEWTGADHIGVFSLEEGIIIERYPIEVRSRVLRPPIWIEPTLSRHC